MTHATILGCLTAIPLRPSDYLPTNWSFDNPENNDPVWGRRGGGLGEFIAACETNGHAISSLVP